MELQRLLLIGEKAWTSGIKNDWESISLLVQGPGNPSLITLRAVELIKKADVVLYDRLVSKKILSMIPKKGKSRLRWKSSW